MKKILLVTRPIAPPWDEASKNFAYQLARNVSSAELHLMTNGYVDSLPSNVVQEPIYSNNRFNYWQKIKCLGFQIQNKSQFDLIHYLFTPTKFSSHLIISLATGSAKTVQTIATLREDMFSEEDIKGMMFADTLVTYSDYSKNRLNLLGFQNVTRIYPGIDLEYFTPTPKDPAVMSQFDIKDNDFVVTYPGEFARLGATDMIINGFVDYWKSNPHSPLKLVMGCRVKNSDDQKKKDEITEMLQAAGFLDRVVFTDTFSEMNKLYNLSDLIIFPVENMHGKFDVPLAIIEAYACARPVILSNIEIFREFSNNMISETIERGNSRELMEAVDRLMNDERRRQELGETARAFVESRFDIARNAKQYEQLYQQILG